MAAGLDIKLKTIDGDDASALAEMTGAIDGNTVPSFQATLEEIKTKGIQRLVLDMSKIKYVNSTGLGSLVKYADTFKSSGGGMALIKVPAKVKIVIEMLGLNAFFDICADLDAALNALKAAGGGAPAGGGAAPAASNKPPRLARKGAAAPAPSSSSGAFTAPAAAPAASGGGGFPQTVACQGCRVQVELTGAGNWKCPRCYTYISAGPDGSVNFNRNDGRAAPLNVSLVASKECSEGLVHLVTSVCGASVMGPKLDALRNAVYEVAQVMQTAVYQNNPNGVYHVSIERDQGRVQIRFADSGATIDSSLATQYFQQAGHLSEFECRPHPAGGNTIRLLQTS